MNPEHNQLQPQAGAFDPQDIEKNKGIAIVAYILFFVPLLAAKDSRFAMYHANQGLLLLLLAIVGNTVGWIIPILGPMLVSIVVLVFLVMGILNAANGQAKPLPLIGSISILK